MPTMPPTHRPPSLALVPKAKRPSAAQRGYDGRWRKASAAYLSKHPVCVSSHCGERSTVVDHIRPHRGDQRLFWDSTNWQALCATCHSTKTARHDGGFGNARR